jgi:multidrug efflux pump subunit AcrA (membrane-fusion protein)
VRVLVAQKSAALLVPAQAVGDDQGGQFVLVVGPDNKVEKRSIVAGPTYQRMRVIDKGVQVAERVITEGLQKVQPGMVVQPKSTDQTDGAPPAATLGPSAQATSK